ncbi:MAG: T9SS type A sorting domain-containing protein [Bacteroidetes bacterium]|nr:T9SS type A sorting domain-containing protein [Bacteroidota bacterium]
MSSLNIVQAQLPAKVLVGYWQNWSTNLKLSQINSNYNVIDLAFATTKGTTDHDMQFTLPGNYSKTAFLADIDALHAAGKVVILSIGGANDPVFLDNNTEKTTFVNSILTILSDYNYKIDGIDIDLETSSLNFGSSWTMTSPAVGQQNLIGAIQDIMSAYQTQTGKKLLLTMAPETVYLMGALSNYQITNLNGGAYLPIIEALKNELDLLHCQYYNAGGASGGTYARDGAIYYDTGDPDYVTAMTETVIKGFTLLNGKGIFSGIPANKVVFGLPANSCNAGGTGYVTPADVCNAAKYLRGIISKPSGWAYVRTTTYPDLRGMMTWSINEDLDPCSGVYSFANNFSCAFGSAVGTDEAEENISLSIYPNPFNTNFTLKISEEIIISDVVMKIYDLYGKEVKIISITGNETIIERNELKSGIYFYSIINDDRKIANGKLVLQ